MAHTDDGGPAFPTTERIGLEPYTRERDAAVPGMSLRDWFAGQAMAGIAARTTDAEFANMREGIRAGGHEARVAYQLADAMLIARDAQSPREVQDQHLDTFGK